MADVFTLAITDVTQCGIVPTMKFCMRELAEMPENLILEHAYQKRNKLIQSLNSPQELLIGGVEMIEKPIVVIGYALLIAALIGWLVLLITDLIDVLPEGLIGLAVIAGFGLLLIKAIKDRLTNKEDNYYSKNIKL